MRELSDVTALRLSLKQRFAPVARYGSIGLAVSGGGDSLALMVLAEAWAKTCAVPPRLVVYSVDHGLRPEAREEAAFVCRAARQLGLSARSLRWEGAKPVAGVQAAARVARYRLMGDAMRADGVAVLLTAHHRRDQAETVLMRLAHGSGLGGARGMDAMGRVEGVPVCRPLLDVPPEVLRQVVAQSGLAPVRDPSNEDRHYERVRWRGELPRLSRLGLDEARIGQFARRAGEADAALEQWAGDCFDNLVRLDRFGAAALPFASFAALPKAVGVRLLARLLEITGSGRQGALGVIERLHERLLEGGQFTGATALGSKLIRRGGGLWFARESGRLARDAAVVAPGGNLVWDRRFAIGNRAGAAAIEIRMAGDLSRRAAERLVGASIAAPSTAIRSAPLVSGADGKVLALGCYRLDSSVTVELSGGRGAIGADVTAN